jgi:TolB-like protein
LRYLFEDYAFDTDRRELHRGEHAISLAPQVFDLLEYLILNKERVVSKDDLINVIWGGRVVSDAALTTRLNAARNAVGDSGEAQRLIRTLPRKGFRFIGAIREEQRQATAAIADEAPEAPKSSLTLPDRPSIAILPFTNLSSDPEQEYFADGMVDEITTALSRFRSIFVIARTSSFTYKGRSVDVKQVGRELGVRYVLEGSVRKAAGKVRITGQLIDATSGAHLWADRFEGNLDDIFGLQDEMTVNVVSAIQPKLLQTEIDHAARRPNDLSAYDLYLRATPRYYSMTREGLAEAVQLLSRALEIDPRYSAAASLAGICHFMTIVQEWATDPKSEIREMVRLSQLILNIADDDPEPMAYAGWTRAYLSDDFDAAMELVDKAVALNPNSSIAWSYRALTCQFAGHYEEAIQSFERSMRLSPLDPMRYALLAGIALGLVSLGRFDEAVVAARKSLSMNPALTMSHRCLAAALAQLGQEAEARKAAAHLMQIAPRVRTSERGARWPQLLVDGLRKAGLPD